MKKHLFACMMCLMALPVFSQTNDSVQWEAYSKIIPSYREIRISAKPDEPGQNGYYYEKTMYIYNNYDVSFLSYMKEGTGGELFRNGSYIASGKVQWDSESKQMKIMLDGYAEADLEYGATANVANQLKGEVFKGRKRIYQYLTLRYDNSQGRFFVTGFDGVTVPVGGARLGGYFKIHIPVELNGRDSNCEFIQN